MKDYKVRTINPYRTFRGAMIPNAVMACRELSQSAKLVWARLAQFAGKDGRCYPKITAIAEGVGVSERQAKRVIKELSDTGFIMVVSPTGQDKLLHRGCDYLFLDHPSFESNKSVPSRGVISDTSGSDVNVTSQEVTKMSPPTQESKTRESLQREKTDSGVTELVSNQESDFEIFWSAYPKKRNKGQARKAWKKIRPGKKLVVSIMAGLSSAMQSRDWEKESGKYIPYPATYLNAEKWEDDIEAGIASAGLSPQRKAELRRAHNKRIQDLKAKKSGQQEAVNA